MQLVALGSQSPGIWQSQLAAAAVRQMSNSAPGGQNLYPQNELQVTISNIPFYTSFVHQVGMSICSVTTKYNSITAQYLRLAICNIFQYILTKFSTSNDQFRWIWISWSVLVDLYIVSKIRNAPVEVFLNGPITASFFFIFVLFKHWRVQQDSNSDRQSRMQACWPLDHHHGPFK